MTFFTGGNSRRANLVGAILTLVLALWFAWPAYAGVATLYKGNEALGQVPAMYGKNGFVISVADAGAFLGLNASVVGEELYLSRGKDRLRIVLDAVAGWYNHQLIPLYRASYVQGGRWWLDVPSSLSLLQYFAGHGSENKLMVEEITQAGEGESAHNAQALAASTTAGPSAETPTMLSDANRVRVVSEPVKSTSNAAQMASSVPIQTFMNDSRAGSDAPGELRAVRWSTSKEKIRAVLDCSNGTNPDSKLISGKIAVPFTSVVDNLQGVPSPYENVKAELVRDANGTATLLFSAAGVRVERLVLDAPRRIVLDFFFNAPTVVREVPQPQTSMASGMPRKAGKKLIVLDPGHGGNDPGAVGNGLKEKDINLGIGLKMEKSLLNKGFDVKMTRRTDVYLKLPERTEFANKADADMFVSIHVNALPPGKNSAGFEIYLMALPTDQDALALAKIENRDYMEDKTGSGATDHRTELLLKILGDMQQNNKINESTVGAEILFKAGNSNGLPMKRVAQAPFFVLRGAGMPAVLLEVGFISNATEAKLLGHSGYQQRIADAMAQGVYNYLKQ